MDHASDSNDSGGLATPSIRVVSMPRDLTSSFFSVLAGRNQSSSRYSGWETKFPSHSLVQKLIYMSTSRMSSFAYFIGLPSSRPHPAGYLCESDSARNLASKFLQEQNIVTIAPVDLSGSLTVDFDEDDGHTPTLSAWAWGDIATKLDDLVKNSSASWDALKR